MLVVRVKDRVLARLVDAERALKQATAIQQTKIVADVAAAQRHLPVEGRRGGGGVVWGLPRRLGC